MVNDDLAKKFNDLGRMIAGHDEELDGIKAQLDESKDEDLKILGKYVDSKIQQLVSNLSGVIAINLHTQTTSNFMEKFHSEIEEMGNQAREKGISLKDYRLELKKNGTLPKHLKALEESIDTLKDTLLPV